MKKFNRALFVPLLLVALMDGDIAPAYAATSPVLSSAAAYGVLASTYTNPVPGTTINGSVGFTTAPATVPAGTHTNYGSGAPYAAAGADQGSALSALNSQPCTSTFPAGAVDLATDSSHGPVGIYAPGVYCTTTSSITSIGAAGITLTGSGTYIFRMAGTFATSANSAVRLTSGASACDVWWTPKPGPTIGTLGMDSIFKGTYIDTSGITLNNNVSWVGRALAFGGTVTTHIDDVITVPTCLIQSPDLLRVVKTVVNDNGGTSVAADFNVHVKVSGSSGLADVAGSPAPGVASPGRDYWLIGNTYVVSEDFYPGYTATFSGDCDASGNVVVGLAPKTCTITNNDNPSTALLRVVKRVVNDNGGTSVAADFNVHVKLSGTDVVGSPAPGVASPGREYSLPVNAYVVSEDFHPGYTATFSGDCDTKGNVKVGSAPKICTITNNDNPTSIPTPLPTPSPTPTLNVFIPKFPNTGINPAGLPLRLKIPIIKVNATIEDIGLTPAGAVDVPKGRGNVGWFNLGPRPGEQGSAVIAGHFARKTSGWAVFNNLYKLRKGDEFSILDSKGKSLNFVVQNSRLYDVNARPREVYDTNSGAHLNLITCAGVWNKSIKGFTKRLVVFADLKE